jgi:hypothetical protein
MHICVPIFLVVLRVLKKLTLSTASRLEKPAKKLNILSKKRNENRSNSNASSAISSDISFIDSMHTTIMVNYYFALTYIAYKL